MDYGLFDHLLNKNGLASEPAFEDVKVSIAPLPPIGGNPLGLYYPDADPQYRVQPGTIWIPPDSDEDTILHELGHRYGHFYANNLSESFAEKYRINKGFVDREPLKLEDESPSPLKIAVIVTGVIVGSIVAIAALRTLNKRNNY